MDVCLWPDKDRVACTHACYDGRSRLSADASGTIHLRGVRGICFHPRLSAVTHRAAVTVHSDAGCIAGLVIDRSDDCLRECSRGQAEVVDSLLGADRRGDFSASAGSGTISRSVDCDGAGTKKRIVQTADTVDCNCPDSLRRCSLATLHSSSRVAPLRVRARCRGLFSDSCLLVSRPHPLCPLRGGCDSGSLSKAASLGRGYRHAAGYVGVFKPCHRSLGRPLFCLCASGIDCVGNPRLALPCNRCQ